MPIPFGVGVGDFIAVGTLIAKVVQELKEVRNTNINDNWHAKQCSFLEYQWLLRDLETLSRSLLYCREYVRVRTTSSALSISRSRLRAAKFHSRHFSSRSKCSMRGLECGTLARGVLRLSAGECSGDSYLERLWRICRLLLGLKSRRSICYWWHTLCK